MYFRALTLIHSVLTVILGLFSDQVSKFLKLSPTMLLVLFVCLVVLTLLVQLYSLATNKSEMVAGNVGVSQRNSPIPTPNSRSGDVAFLLGLVFGSAITTLLISFGKSEVLLSYGLIGIREYEFWALLVGAALCFAYWRLKGLDGLTVFGLGLGLAIGITIILLDTSNNGPVETLVGHTVLMSAVAITFRTSREKWRYALAVPMTLGAFWLVPVAPWIASSLLYRPDYSVQDIYMEYVVPGRYTQYYEVPFISPPQLIVSVNGYSEEAAFKIVYQDSSKFEIEIHETTDFPIELRAEARGRPIED